MPKKKVAPMVAGRLFPNRTGTPKATNRLFFFAGVNAFANTVLKR
ncbi:MAG TPA: hypothetical protein VHQ04_13005 [Puia sp.]|nr:hypothetical protein [Puia sp.]